MKSEAYQKRFFATRTDPSGRRSAIAPPPFRRLRGYAFDPSLSLRMDTALINETVFEVPWDPDLSAGPVDEYLEVVDYDPASACWYEPVNLNAPELLGQDGLAPSEGNPQFHQQMVYAVARNTIKHFERALGRPIFWAPLEDPAAPSGKRETFVAKLRVYPHALRTSNAYYSPHKKSLLFGYFPGPSGMVFTCLSHDIVAHETTHAVLDGMHRRYIEDNHEDTIAFHEAFADLVALFQHFTFPEVLRHQIARTRGDLAGQSLLGELAQQFGEATGSYGALRSAIGQTIDGRWQPLRPDPGLLATTREPHARGAILVAAMFRAFLSIYRSRVADLLRLATAGTGELAPGAIHPDLVNRLAIEAAKTARHFLTISIRALDYCPPVDVTFGDYLRALITGDFDMVPNDRLRYRVALIESFRQWGITAEGVRTHSEEHLRWPFAHFAGGHVWGALDPSIEKLRKLVSESLYFQSRDEAFSRFTAAQAQLHQDLKALFIGQQDAAIRQSFEQVTGLVLDEARARFEVHAIRPALRVSPDGDIVKQVIITITQRRKVQVDLDDAQRGEMQFRGGSTLILDLETLKVRYAVTKAIDDEARLARVRDYRRRKAEDDLSLRASYFGAPAADDDGQASIEPFALLHSDE